VKVRTRRCRRARGGDAHCAQPAAKLLYTLRTRGCLPPRVSASKGGLAFLLELHTATLLAL